MSMSPTLTFATFAALAPLLLAAADAKCGELSARAVSELQREQYPTMLSIAEDRQRLCPGAESSFLVGLAKANMIDKLLVSDGERAFVREQALTALRAAVNDIRAEWQATALTWIRYLEESADADEPAPVGPPAETSERGRPGPPVAPPFIPDTFPWGPVVLGTAGVLTLSAALVTGVIGNAKDSQLEQSMSLCKPRCALTLDQRMSLRAQHDEVTTFYTVTNVLLVVGAASLGGALLWYALRGHHADPELSMMPHVGVDGAGAQVLGRF